MRRQPSSGPVFLNIKTDRRVATHEAGHAVAARLLGHPLGGATVDPGAGYDQPNPRLPHRARHHGASGADALAQGASEILSSDTGALSPRMVGLIADLAKDWRRLDERIAAVSAEVEALAEQDDSCQRLMTVPGVGPIIASAVVAAATLALGWGSCRSRNRRGIAQSWARSPSAATST